MSKTDLPPPLAPIYSQHIFSPESVNKGFVLPEAKVMNSAKDEIFNSKGVWLRFYHF